MVLKIWRLNLLQAGWSNKALRDVAEHPPAYIWKGIHHIYEKSYFKSMGGNYLINTRGIIGHSVGEDKNQIRFLPHNIYKLIPEGLKNQVKIF